MTDTQDVLPTMLAEARGYKRAQQDAANLVGEASKLFPYHVSSCVRGLASKILALTPTNTPKQTKPPEAEA